MSTPSARLAQLGLSLPPVATPLAAYVPAIVSSGHVYTSGQLPSVAGEPDLRRQGRRRGHPRTGSGSGPHRHAERPGRRRVSLVGGLDQIGRIVKVTVFVASAPTFTGQPAVANGASELVAELFGDAGRHVRSAVDGVSVLPLDAPVEVELTIEPAGVAW